jgi:hypothetical protein
MLSSAKENKSASVSADGTKNIPPSAIPKRYTLCQVAHAESQAKTWQRVCFSQPKKKFIFSSHPSVFYFFANTRPKTDKHLCRA